MAEFVRQSIALEEVLPVHPIRGTLGLVRDSFEVKSAVISSTEVEWRSGLKWAITGIFASDDRVKSEQQAAGLPNYIVYTDRAETRLYWKSMDATWAWPCVHLDVANWKYGVTSGVVLGIPTTYVSCVMVASKSAGVFGL